MAITTQTIDYDHDGDALEAYLASPNEDGARPGIVICHAWAGRSAFENSYAEKVAEMGYAGLAIDLFGKGVLGTSKEENQKLIEPFVTDRNFLKSRLMATLDMARGLDAIDGAKIVVMGFCFGGLCALDVARAGADVKGCASFHGLLNPPPQTADRITAKVIAYHGYDDPMADPDAMRGFCDEMTTAKADWQVNAFGGVMHAFTNPQANDPDFGTVYDEQARDRAWASFTAFAKECFGD